MLPSWLSGLLLWLFGNAAWDFLFAIVIAGMIAYLRSKKEKWAAPVLYGLAAFTLILIVGYTLTGRAPLSPPPPQAVMPENVEDNIKVWADHLAMGLQRKNVPDSDFFYYTVTVNNIPVDIYRAKSKPGYLQLESRLNFSPEHQAAMMKLSERDFKQFINQLGLELSRLRLTANLALSFDEKTRQPRHATIVVDKAIPISNLNEGYFSSECDEVTGAIYQMRAFVNRGLGTDVTDEALKSRQF
jgi:hypothetical protein